MNLAADGDEVGREFFGGFRGEAGCATAVCVMLVFYLTYVDSGF